MYAIVIDACNSNIIAVVYKQKRFAGWFNTEQQPGYSNTKKKYARKKGTTYSYNDKTVYARCKNCNQKEMRKHQPFLTNRKFRQ